MGQALAIHPAAEDRFDDLTGLHMRRSFYQRLDRELLAADGVVSMLMIDVDHYKHVNDTYGHLTGDVLLAQLADILRASVRELDMVARYAGDEFAVIMPGTSRVDAKLAARRLLEAVAGHVFKGDGGDRDIFITMSIGVAAYPDDARTVQDLVRAADRALYQAKNAGRNRVCGPDDITRTNDEVDPYDITFASKELIGRSEQLAKLHKDYIAAIEGRGGMVLVSGEAGIGKTRLVTHFIGSLTPGDQLAIRGCCYEASQALPYGPVIDFLHDLLRSAADNRELAEAIGSLVTNSPGVRSLLPELSVGELPPIVPLNPAMAQFRLFEEICRILLAAARKPLIVFLDDLQWADTGTLGFIEYLVRSTKRSQIAVIGTYRTEEVDSKGSRHALLDFRARLSREDLYTSIELQRLTITETSQFIKSVFNMSFLTDEFAHLIYSQSAGNPFFVEQVLKMLVDEGAIYPAAVGWHRKDIKELSIPGSINDVLTRRLKRLADDARQALALAAVIGEEFSFDVLHALSGLNEGHLLDIIDQAIDAHVIREAEDGEDYAFAHPQLRVILYRDFSTRRRKQYHLRVAAILAARPGVSSGELADHYLAAGSHAEALKSLLAAAAQAGEVYAHHTAIKRYSQALELIKEGHGREYELEVTEALGDVYITVGDERSLQMFEAALTIAGDDRLIRGRIHRKAGTANMRRGNLDQALELLRAALSDLEATGDDVEMMTALGITCAVLVQKGQTEEAEAMAKLRLRLAGRHGGLHLGIAHTDLAHVYFYRRDYAQAEEHLQQCIGYLSEDAGLNYAARAYNNLGAVVGERGDTARAYEYFGKALAAAEKAGNAHMTAMVCGNLAEEYAKRGRVEEGQDYLNRALAIYQRTGNKLGVAESWLLQAYIHRIQDRVSDACEAARKALQVATDGGIQEWIIRARCSLAEVLLHGGLTVEATTNIDAAEQLAREARMDFLLPYALRARSWLAFSDGRTDDALGLLTEAVGLFERFENKFELAVTHRAQGRILIRRDGWFSEAAQAEFSQALALFESLQARLEFDRTVAVCQDDTREAAARRS